MKSTPTKSYAIGLALNSPINFVFGPSLLKMLY